MKPNIRIFILNKEKENKMECLNCKKDYFDNTILVNYDGEYNHKEMIDYVKRSYPNERNYEIVEHGVPYTYKGFRNFGNITISCV